MDDRYKSVDIPTESVANNFVANNFVIHQVK